MSEAKNTYGETIRENNCVDITAATDEYLDEYLEKVISSSVVAGTSQTTLSVITPTSAVGTSWLARQHERSLEYTHEEYVPLSMPTKNNCWNLI